ncbi:MAG TPA: hypothetical protein VN893_16990 [Bryobacteraceae bacterium]|nr:hypothetical protein [Bryobacteraceae bacterium]
MKARTLAVVWIAATVLAGVVVAGRAAAQQAGDVTVLHRYMPPVTITQESPMWGDYLGQKMPEKITMRSEFRFSTDGSQAECSGPGTDDPSNSGLLCKVRRADGVFAILHPGTKTIYAVRSGRGRQEEGMLGPLPETSCLANEFGSMGDGRLVGESKILGYRVFEIEYPADTHGEDTHYRTAILAPDLNCFSLRQVVRMETTFNGVLEVQHSENRTLSIVPGEPDAAKFRLPTDWQRVKPSMFMRSPGIDNKKMDAAWEKSHYDGE